jgi:hypothetical protein
MTRSSSSSSIRGRRFTMVAIVNATIRDNPRATFTNERTFNIGIETFGAVLCWMLAGYYYYKKWLKRRRRMLKQKEQQEQHQDEEKSSFLVTNDNAVTSGRRIENSTTLDEVNEPTVRTSDNMETNYGSCKSDDSNKNTVSFTDPSTTSLITETTISNDNASDNKDRQSFQPWTIVTLTISGALDEISYFPSLIIGHIFTGTELIVGTFITVLIMLCIVTQLLQYCQPLLHCLDQIPLYGVITLYAIILTINLILDSISSN